MMLVRALGETRCRQCEWTKPSSSETTSSRSDTALADDVAAALQRRFDR
jgi:hypothetical protein